MHSVIYLYLWLWSIDCSIFKCKDDNLQIRFVSFIKSIYYTFHQDKVIGQIQQITYILTCSLWNLNCFKMISIRNFELLSPTVTMIDNIQCLKCVNSLTADNYVLCGMYSIFIWPSRKLLSISLSFILSIYKIYIKKVAKFKQILFDGVEKWLKYCIFD